MNNANGPLHSERPTPAPLPDPDENLSLSQLTERDARDFVQDVTQKLEALLNAPTPPLDTPAVPLGDLLAEAKEMALAGVAAQADVDAILSAGPTPEQISAQISAEECASPCLPPFAALQAWCAAQPPLTAYDPMWQSNPDIHAIIAAHLREDIKALRAQGAGLEQWKTVAERRELEISAARDAIQKLGGKGFGLHLAQAVRDLVSARDEGLAAIKEALSAEGHTGNPLDAIRVLLAERTELKADRDQWKRQAEASAASYRALSKRVEKSAHDQTVEVKL